MAKKSVTTKKTVKKVSKKTAVKKAVKPRAPQVKKEKLYKLDFELNGTKTTVEGDSVIECITQLKPLFYKTKAVFVFYFNGKTCRRVLLPFAVKRTLAVKFNQEVFQNRINKLFK